MLLLLLLTTVLLLQLETLSEEEEKGAIDKETIGHFLVTQPRKSDQDLSEEVVKLFRLDIDSGNSNPPKALRIKGERNGGCRNYRIGPKQSKRVKNICNWSNKRKPVCQRNAKYRTEDGSCNNLKNALIGSSGTPFSQMLKATYHNRGNTPRNTSTSGQLLP